MVDASSRPRAVFSAVVFRAAVAGVLAGGILAIGELLVSSLGGEGLRRPVQLASSVLLDRAALTNWSWPLVLTALFVHFGLSALFGAVWGLLVSALPAEVRDDLRVHATGAAIYGLSLWLLNFQLLARIAQPWFLETSALVQAGLHAFAFGLPLGLLLAARLRPVEGAPRPRRTPAS